MAKLIKLKGKFDEDASLDIKRPYLPGLSIEATCPQCAKKRTKDLNVDYLRYLPLNGVVSADMSCHDCAVDIEGYLHIQLKVKVLDSDEVDVS